MGVRRGEGKTCRGKSPAGLERAKLARQSKLFLSVLVFQEGECLETVQVFPAGKNSSKLPAGVS